MTGSPRQPSAARGGFVFLALAACRIPAPAGHQGTPVDAGDPAITEIAWSCDVDDEAWTLSVEASAWTGGGELLLTVDGVYVEAHAVYAEVADDDGQYELLELELDLEPDWREVNEGSSTLFTCGDAPAALFVLYDLDGEQADCRVLAGDDVWPAVPDAPGCGVSADGA